jgi:hypothetical protein
MQTLLGVLVSQICKGEGEVGWMEEVEGNRLTHDVPPTRHDPDRMDVLIACV